MLHSPLQLKQSEMYGYFVRGDLARLQATVNTTLNQVAGKRMTLKALSPYVMLTFTRFPGGGQAHDPESAVAVCDADVYALSRWRASA